MKRKIYLLLTILCLFLTNVSLFAQDEKKTPEPKTKEVQTGDKQKAQLKEPSPIEGIWKVISGKRMGADSSSDRLPPSITVKGDRLTIPTPDGEAFVMSFKYDKTKKPMEFDFKIEAGPAPGGTALGIVKVEEGKATLCYSFIGGERPKKFESTEKNQCHLFVMEKEAETLTAETLVGKWKVSKGVRSGAKVAQDRMPEAITFEKDKITMPAGPESFVMGYKIDNSKSPAQIDMKILSGPAPEGSPALGIIKMEDGKMWLCYDAMGGGRPEKFESTADNGFFLFVLEK